MLTLITYQPSPKLNNNTNHRSLFNKSCLISLFYLTISACSNNSKIKSMLIWLGWKQRGWKIGWKIAFSTVWLRGGWEEKSGGAHKFSLLPLQNTISSNWRENCSEKWKKYLDKTAPTFFFFSFVTLAFCFCFSLVLSGGGFFLFSFFFFFFLIFIFIIFLRKHFWMVSYAIFWNVHFHLYTNFLKV